MLERPATELVARIRAEEWACFDRLRDALVPEQRRALVAKMAELQDQAAEIEHEERRRLSGPRRHE
jgi:hypothetical protein